MERGDRPAFRPGRNIAVKLPERHYAATLAFYRDVLGLEILAERGDGAIVAFGAMRLHLDRGATSEPDGRLAGGGSR